MNWWNWVGENISYCSKPDLIDFIEDNLNMVT